MINGIDWGAKELKVYRKRRFRKETEAEEMNGVWGVGGGRMTGSSFSFGFRRAVSKNHAKVMVCTKDGRTILLFL